MSAADRESLKRALLGLLEEDREFRYTVMGLLGFRELLERFAKLEQRYQRLEERFAAVEERVARLEERFVKLEERYQQLEERFAELEQRFARLEERYQRLEERFQQLEERFVKLEERVARLEERFAKLEERFAKLEERVARLEEETRETRRVVLTIAHRFGLLSEEAFREAMKYVVKEVFGVATVEKWVYRDEEGFVYGYPSIVEVDILVRDGEHILLEVKSRVSKADVSELHRIGQLYEKVEGKKPRLAILGGMIDREAQRLAKKLGVEITPIFSDTPY